MEFAYVDPMKSGFNPIPGGIGAMVPKISRGGLKRTVDYASNVITYLENRLWQRDKRDQPIVQPDVAYFNQMVPPVGCEESPVNAITTKFVKTVYNKQRCPIFCTSWAPDGRRLITGAASGEFSLWNGISLNFEAVMKSHDGAVRSMVWSHNGLWMATADDKGIVKYWQSNMSNVHTFQAHNEIIRGLSFSPTDAKLATCSDDGTVRVFDFLQSCEEFILRGHGADVKCVDWHPRRNLLVSGSKDNQQPIKLWDPKAGQSVATIHAHKAAVMSVQWNRNGNWLLTASRDHLIKLFDIRTMKEMDVLKGHKNDVNTIAWHPTYEKLFASGGSDGAILFWLVGNKRDIGGMESPHDSFVWSLSWHPLGHVLCSGSNDHTCKFWCRNRPGDEMKDRFSSGGPLAEEMATDSDVFGGSSLPGMGASSSVTLPPPPRSSSDAITLPPPSSKTWSTPQSAIPNKSATTAKSSAVDVQLPILGADIIKEQFGKAEPPSGPPAKPGPQPGEADTSGQFPPPPSGREGIGVASQPPPGFGQGEPPFPLNPAHLGQPPHHPHPPPPHPPMRGEGGMGRGGGPPHFQGPRPPPMPQHRRDWPEQGMDFHGPPPQLPPSPHGDFPRPFGRGYHSPNPFSWQRQDYRERRMSYEEEGRFQNEPPRNPYVYRREEENKLRDPREQRLPMGGRGRGGGGVEGGGEGEDLRRMPPDGHSPDWRGERPPMWAQEHRGPPPSHPHQLGQHQAEFPERGPPGPQEVRPPLPEQRRDFGPPRDQLGSREDGGGGGGGDRFPPVAQHGGPPQKIQGGEPPHRPFHEGENWRPPFGRNQPAHADRPPHEVPPQERPPQGHRFPQQHHPQSHFPHHNPDPAMADQPPPNRPNQGPSRMDMPTQQDGQRRQPPGPLDPRSQRGPEPQAPQPHSPPPFHQGGPPRPPMFQPEGRGGPLNQPPNQDQHQPQQQQHQPRFPGPGQPPRDGPAQPPGPRGQVFEEFRGQPRQSERLPPPSEQYFQNQQGRPPSPHAPPHRLPPHPTDTPNPPQPHQFPPPHSRPPPSQEYSQGPPSSSHGGPPGQRFPAPHPPRPQHEQEQYHSPQHFGPQGPPAPYHTGQPPPSHMPRDPPHFDQFGPGRDPPEKHGPRAGPPQQPPPGLADPRMAQQRQHPPNYQGVPPDRGPPPQNPPGEHYPPHHPHIPPQQGPPQDHFNERGYPPQSDPNWGHQQPPTHHPGHQQFPTEDRFEANRDPRDRRANRGDMRERERERDRERDRDRERERERERGHRERSPKHHRSAGVDPQPPAAKRSRSERDSDKRGRREKRK